MVLEKGNEVWRGLSTDLASKNPTVPAGVLVIEEDTGVQKVGNGQKYNTISGKSVSGAGILFDDSLGFINVSPSTGTAYQNSSGNNILYQAIVSLPASSSALVTIADNQAMNANILIAACSAGAGGGGGSQTLLFLVPAGWWFEFNLAGGATLTNCVPFLF